MVTIEEILTIVFCNPIAIVVILLSTSVEFSAPKASSGSMACILKHGGVYLTENSCWRDLIGVFSILTSRKSISDCRQFVIGYFYTALSKLSIVKQTIGDSYR